MKAKTKIGMWRRRRKSVLNALRTRLYTMKKHHALFIAVPKQGGILPLIPIFTALSALEALGGGAAGIAKAVNDAKSTSKQLQEAERHNKTMEAIAMGKGLYLRPYKTGRGSGAPQKKTLTEILPKQALTNIDLLKYAQQLRLRHFRGVFIRNELPRKIWSNEFGIVNLYNKKMVKVVTGRHM